MMRKTISYDVICGLVHIVVICEKYKMEKYLKKKEWRILCKFWIFIMRICVWDEWGWKLILEKWT